MDQVAVVGVNSGKYDLNMIKQYFLERISENLNDKSIKSRWLRKTTITCF